MAKYSFKGLLRSCGDTTERTYKDKVFYSRVFIVEQKRFDPYSGEPLGSNYVGFEMSGKEKCDSLDAISLGSVVDVEFVINGIMYTKDNQERNFTKLAAISVNIIRSGTMGGDTLNTSENTDKTESDDLPFN